VRCRLLGRGVRRAAVVFVEEWMTRTVPLVGRIVHAPSVDLPWQREGARGF